MAQYLLDTDVCIEIIRQNERVLGKVEAVGEDNCFVTDITIAEFFMVQLSLDVLIILKM